ncbi:hypothetical protein NQ176_g4428 [Zarea fungicola]|uniref:Uncharacterized protein n=1 Tax=Zarea fungicola TaxID=93591 RepID=A0ACC1NES8_9HYPO|nr:hypothetical protein NQ176_g4428 [Lecanicillium fungicola]
MGGGKAKPLKAKKKVAVDYDSDDERRMANERETRLTARLIEAKELKAAQQAAASSKGPLKMGSQGLKKSGKK